MYRIGFFSKISKVTIKTLRYYDEVNLLKPEHVDPENGYRYYTANQLFDLHKIIALRQIGFSIDEVISIINGRNVDEILNQRKLEILKNLRENQDQLSRIENYIKERNEGFSMNYQAVIKKLPEVMVYSKRIILKTYADYFKVIPEIEKTIKMANPNMKCKLPRYCFNIYHDGEYKEKDIDIEYCQAVEEMGKEIDGIVFKKVPTIKAVTIMHKGAYSELRKAYSYIFKWIEENGYTVKDSPRESYIDGIWNGKQEKDWLTEIQVPIE